MNLIRCKKDDFDRITNFYRYVTQHTPGMVQNGRWIYGQHPTDEMIERYITAGNMYYIENNSQMMAAVALTPFQESDYNSVDWSRTLKDDEVCVVHLLCVNPDMQRSGIAKALMKAIIDLAKKTGKRAVRLDALSCNEPANELYKKIGFVKCGTQNWFAENTGWIDFYLYEFVLD